jgi:alginate O-acetyltransferase complex protein AlgI
MNQILDLLKYNPQAPLLFTGMYFWVFFTFVLGLYSFIYKSTRARNIFLFLISLFFYYKSGGYFFILLIFSTIVDYVLGLFIYNTATKWKKKLYVTFSIITNLSVLSYFKYTYFFTGLFNDLFQTHYKAVNYLALWSNQLTGTNIDIFIIILPVGISFYTFQTISYSVDVYRGKLPAVKNFFDFGFYVTFFPQLVAGPIVRAAQFIPQIHLPYVLTKTQFGYAIFLIISGLIKKMVISDYLSINFIDRVFDAPMSYSGIEILFAIYAYALQIYCDFSGYTDIAIGTAQLLGFKLPINFFSPYKATSITDFWRRWHISLSTWLRDYLYIPLGGNRKGKLQTEINLLITMLLGGLWHGANLRFVFWGLMHGFALIIHKLWQLIFGKTTHNRVLRFFYAIITFHFVCFCWVFFRAVDFKSALVMINRIIYQFDYNIIGQFISGYRISIALLFIGFLIHWLPEQWKEAYRGLFIKTPLIIKIVAIVLTVFLIYQFKTSAIQPFIYFRF